jgi:ribose transport system permease protein
MTKFRKSDAQKNSVLSTLGDGARKVPVNVYLLVIMIAFFGAVTPPGTFLSIANFMNVIEQTVVLAIVAVAACLALISKGVDLSLGMTMSMSGVIAAQLAVQMGWPVPFAFLVAILSGTCMGMLNGLIISKHKVAPFIITLATTNIARSLAFHFSGLRTVPAHEPNFRWIASGYVLQIIPVGIFVVLLLYFIFNYLMTKRRLGTYIFAIGGNEAVAKLSGISVARTKFLTYTMTGTLGGIAGVMLAARLGAANPAQGQGFEFFAIASAVVGGVSMFGGRGSVWKTLTGAFIISTLRNGLNMAQMSTALQMVTLGAIIVAVVYLDNFFGKEKR